MTAPPLLLTARGISKTYGRGSRSHTVLHRTDLDIFAGESVAVIGRSGAGKSTLAEIILGLSRPSTGTVHVGGEPFADARSLPPRRLRRRVQGVAQDASASLPPRSTVRRTCQRAIDRLAGQEGTSDWLESAAAGAHFDLELLDRTPGRLSGGQGQRAAITRALAVQPDIIVADEPTSALDSEAAAVVAQTLLELPKGGERALIVVTHDDELAARCDRVLRVDAGRIISGGPVRADTDPA